MKTTEQTVDVRQDGIWTTIAIKADGTRVVTYYTFKNGQLVQVQK